MESWGEVLGGWGAGDHPHQAVLLPRRLLRPAQTIILKSTKGPLVSTLLELVSTHYPKIAQKVF
ncbi:hypothetical protein Taro_046369 [Colocasia esculenta]|uniref:Uncharacterized protein n=1 Tax=Colocasia esculenta TaxID=4460 RepID=A0A843WPQ2_COLES|nr:hypothetical protein [Colocasia esculenta]